MMANKWSNLFLGNGTKQSLWKTAFNYLLVIFFIAGIFTYAISRLDYTFQWNTLTQYQHQFLMGFYMTIVISFFSLILSLIMGTFFAFARRSKILFLQYFSKIYVEIIRGTPFLVQIYFFYFIMATAIGLKDKYILGIIILSIFSGAYVTEIIRGGIESIDKSQIDTARALGFTAYQKYRYIIIPQAIKRIMPSLAGQLSSLVKDSSLLSVIAVSELTMNVLEIDSLNFRTFENLSLLGLGYLLLTIPISLISKKLERKFHYEA